LNAASLAAQFIDTPEGRLFVVEHSPSEGARDKTTLLVPPLGDEMNKSRALFAQLGKTLSEVGRTLVLGDLYGTGDSEGDFATASIDLWSKNLDALVAWAETRGSPIDSIVAVRFGCLLASHWVRNSGRDVSATAFWQPTVTGAQIVNQWLRLRVAASMFDGDEKTTSVELDRRLDEGQSLEVGGYLLTPALARDLRSLQLSDLLCSGLGALSLFEVGSAAECSPAVRQLGQGRDIRQMSVVAGDAFWSATEIVRNPVLVARTVDALCAAGAAP
jgi:exosortase A-associated hydrolase 2